MFVECLKCGVENPANANFCAGCGTKVGSVVCEHCGADNAPDSSFCIDCGEPLTTDAPPQALRSAHAERRILTVLFCDLVDSTALVDNLDPELSRTIIRDFKIISKLGKHHHCLVITNRLYCRPRRLLLRVQSSANI